MSRRIRKGRRAARNSTVSSCRPPRSLRPFLRQNFPAPPPSSSSANASFLSPPPPPLRLPPPPSAAQAFIGRRVDVNAGGGAAAAGCARPRAWDWAVSLAPPSPGLVTRLVRSRCLEPSPGPPAPSCSRLIGRRLTATGRGVGRRRQEWAGRREAGSARVGGGAEAAAGPLPFRCATVINSRVPGSLSH